MNNHLKYLVLALTLLLLHSTGLGQRIELRGIHKGEPIFLINPFLGGGKAFCIDSILVNGTNIGVPVDQATIELQLDMMDIACKDSVLVTIYHQDSCQPRILGPEVASPKLRVHFDSVSIDSLGRLRWSTSNDYLPGSYEVEHFRWNQWVRVPEVKVASMGLPCDQSHEYEVKVMLFAGEHKFRIRKQVSGRYRVSEVVQISRPEKEITYEYHPTKKQVLFNAPTLYQILDFKGNMLVQGAGSQIDLSIFRKGKYTLNYGNSSVVIEIKRR